MNVRTIASLVVAGGSFHTAAVASTLQDFVSQYAQISSLSVSAAVEYLLDPALPACGGPAGISITGTYSFSAKDQMWRSRSFLDHPEVKDLRTEVAYDGNMFQYHVLDDDVLGVSFGSDDRAAGMILPNPLFAAVQFLIPVSDTNASETERLSDIQDAAATANYANLSWTLDPQSRQSLEYTDLPGATHEDHAYFHRVFVLAGQRDKPVRIDRISTTGAVLTRTLLSKYADFGNGLEFPTSYAMILYDPASGAESGRIEMSLDAYGANTAVTEALDSIDFQIPWSLAGRVWLIDNEVFVN
jgi:hypothetical protein